MSERKAMTNEQFNAFMKRCKTEWGVRYVRPTIHPRAGVITCLDIITSEEVKQLTITNNPDPDFNLTEAAHEYLDKRKGEVTK
ncbi:hypothetical protein AAV35_012790 [Salimicrobium jeotgali]|uniref:Uncharacterized protein n=1 Tax=Salimicrobium jeotgali TaxID=1230341 RepID=K2G5F5_9BACI|nr:hypothetical protein [Salimicrobium jeotgali]AKG05539.1 hypothetical protein AAV35_012790 [Salimicrobium jeotgali]EKE30468.1 hypothetical protein MJ3_13544 [Salimicrobium jeotgali]MBM7696614.1 hypothetical protein [Salimicrobium jeotgali]